MLIHSQDPAAAAALRGGYLTDQIDMSEVLSICLSNQLRLIVVKYHDSSEVIERLYKDLGGQA